MTQHIRSVDAEGLAALGICESLILTLTDLGVINEQDARGLLGDVATTHASAATVSHAPEVHEAVVEIISRILAGKNGSSPPG